MGGVGCGVASSEVSRFCSRTGLASGYYYPTARPDVVAMGTPALPLIGDILSYTVSPLISRAIWPLMMAKIFGPRSVPKRFAAFPKELAMRPSQVRASAAESALMIPDAFRLRNQYADLKMSVAIIAGEQDRLIDIDTQSLDCIPMYGRADFTELPITVI